MVRGKKPKKQARDPRSNLPSLTRLLEGPETRDLMAFYPAPLVKDALREARALFARAVGEGASVPAATEVVHRAGELLEDRFVDRIRPVVNATGIVLHTGLGRAPLPPEAAHALADLHRCCNLQIDMETGLRGKRNYTTEQLLCRLTGAEAAMVVNNNAAATYLILTALCKDTEVIVSRGQLIEIGGSFRLPDCMRQSGALLREVGTTNKTHLRDYETALSENTGAVLRVFPSNYRIVGFTQQVSIAELASLKAKRPFLLVDDLGCGALVDLSRWGLPKEPTVPESIAAGSDLVCSSGDKLIGGPQAGIIVGKKAYITRLKQHPLARMLRVCKMTDTALEHTLRLFLEPDRIALRHPTLRMIATPLEELRKRARGILRRLKDKPDNLEVRVEEGESAVGGGTMPDHPLPTWVLSLRSPTLSPETLAERLRRNDPPVIARIAQNAVLLDMRTLLKGEDRIVAEALIGLEKS